MAARRSYGTGSLVERPAGSGKWLFRYVTGTDPVTKKMVRRSVTLTAKNKTAAQAQANKILVELDQAPAGSRAPVHVVLSEWMAFQTTRGRSPTTLYGYQKIIDRNLVPAIGEIPVSDLTAHHLDTLYAQLTRDGLSASTVKGVHRVISAALNQAVKRGWIDKNPAQRATTPDQSAPKLEVPSPDQARALIAACREHDELLGAFVFLSAVTGCRRGEITALRWPAVQGSHLVIKDSAFEVAGRAGVKSTKSGKERLVHLDEPVTTWLEAWRQRCESVASEFGVTLESDAFIFSSRPDGSRMVTMGRMSGGFRTVADSLGMPQFHLHSLRHFVATELLAAGLSAKDTAEMLGHADPSLTLRVYAHATQSRQVEAARTMAAALTDPSPEQPMNHTGFPRDSMVSEPASLTGSVSS
jgi:integrase